MLYSLASLVCPEENQTKNTFKARQTGTLWFYNTITAGASETFLLSNNLHLTRCSNTYKDGGNIV